MLNSLLAKVDPMFFILGGLVLVFVVMIVMQTRKRRTAQAEYTGMLEALRPGMRVKTVGGVIGTIREIREEAPGFKTVLLETGTEKNPSLVLYDLQAIYGVVNDEKIAALVAQAQVSAPMPVSDPSAEQRVTSEPKDVKDKSSADDGVKERQNVFETKKGKDKSK